MGSDTGHTDLQVFVTGTSDRLWKIADPLSEVGNEVSTLQITGKESIRPLIQQMKETDPDVVITDALGRAGMAAFVVSKYVGSACVIRIRGDTITERSSVLKENLQNMNLLKCIKDTTFLLSTILLLIINNDQIFVSEYCRDRSKTRFFASSEAAVIPTPVRDNHESNTHSSSYREKKILSVSNFNFWQKTKGLADSINIISEVLENNPDWSLEIAGAGKYHPTIKSAVDQANTDSINILGYVNNTDELYDDSDIFVHFSYLDAYPSTVLEAKMNNLPVVANSGVGMTDQIVDGETGYIVDLADREDVISSISELVRNDNKRTQMGSKAANEVKSRNSLSTIGEEFHDYLIQVLKS